MSGMKCANQFTRMSPNNTNVRSAGARRRVASNLILSIMDIDDYSQLK